MYERQIFIYDFLIEYADLMVDFLIAQLAECLFRSNNTVFIVFNSVNDIIVCHTALYNIVQLLHVTTTPTVYHVLKPFQIVRFKNFDTKVIGLYRIVIQCICRNKRLSISAFSLRYCYSPRFCLRI